MNLFQVGNFTLRSGVKSRWKIECDALTPEDWAGLAAMAVEMLPSFGRVFGVPRGGVPFADALRKHASGGTLLPLLIAEDVVTTGDSMQRFRQEKELGINVIGIAAFACGKLPDWVQAVFHYGGKR